MAESGGLFIIDAEDAGSDPWEWTAIDEDGSNDFKLSAASKNNGDNGYECDFDGSSADAYGVKDFASEETDVYVRMYVYISSGLSIGDGTYNYMSILRLTDNAGGEHNSCAYIGIGNYGQDTVTRWYVGGNNISVTNYATNFSTGAWHYVEVRYVKHASTGGVEVWVDGDELISDLDQDTSGRGAYHIQCGLGPTGTGAPDSAAAYIYIDDIKADNSYIGVYADAGGSIVPHAFYGYSRRR